MNSGGTGIMFEIRTGHEQPELNICNEHKCLHAHKHATHKL